MPRPKGAPNKKKGNKSNTMVERLKNGDGPMEVLKASLSKVTQSKVIESCRLALIKHVDKAKILLQSIPKEKRTFADYAAYLNQRHH